MMEPFGSIDDLAFFANQPYISSPIPQDWYYDSSMKTSPMKYQLQDGEYPHKFCTNPLVQLENLEKQTRNLIKEQITDSASYVIIIDEHTRERSSQFCICFKHDSEAVIFKLLYQDNQMFLDVDILNEIPDQMKEELKKLK